MQMKDYQCHQCNKDFKRYPSTVRNPDKVFCCKKCANESQKQLYKGNGNPNFKNGKWTKASQCMCGNEKDCRASQCAVCSKKGYPKNNNERDSEQDIRESIADSKSFLEASKKLNTNRSTLKKITKKLDISIDHFVPCSHRPILLSMLLQKGTVVRRGTVKKRILDSKLIEHICEICKIGPRWNNKELVLQLDHIDGDSTNNKIGNLRFLCPNCHSQTSTFTGRNYGRSK